MDHIEMVQKLNEKAGISLAEAKDVLERTDWDMLEALLLLEREGKIPPVTASASTSDSDTRYEETASSEPKKKSSSEAFNKKMRTFSDKLRDFLLKGFTHDFVIRRGGDEIVCIPLAFLIIIAIFAFYPILVALVIGLFLDCAYSVEKRSERDSSSDSTT